MEPEHDFHKKPLLPPGHRFQVSSYFFGGVHKKQPGRHYMTPPQHNAS